MSSQLNSHDPLSKKGRLAKFERGGQVEEWTKPDASSRINEPGHVTTAFGAFSDEQ